MIEAALRFIQCDATVISNYLPTQTSCNLNLREHFRVFFLCASSALHGRQVNAPIFEISQVDREGPQQLYCTQKSTHSNYRTTAHHLAGSHRVRKGGWTG